jgi:hypothetical protein
MRKGIRVFAAVALLLVLSSGSAAFAAPRDSQDGGLFARFLSWVLYSRLSPPIGAPTTNSRLSPPGGAPTTDSRWSPPGGAPTTKSRLSPPTGAPVTDPAPQPEPQSRLSPPTGLTDPPATTT